MYTSMSLLLAVLAVTCFDAIAVTTTTASAAFCEDCVYVPVRLSTGIDSENIIMAYNSDSEEMVARGVCSAVGISISSEAFLPCVESTVASVLNKKWQIDSMEELVQEQGFRLSHFMLQTVLAKARRYHNPRLLVIGAGQSAPAFRSLLKRGYMGAVERPSNRTALHLATGVRDFSSRHFNFSQDIQQPADYFVGSSALAEGLLNGSVDDVDRLHNDRDEIAEIPWDIVVLHLSICEPGDSACRQTYLNYAAKVTTEDGYLFVHSSENENEISLPNDIVYAHAESKFHSYVHMIPHHVGNRGGVLGFFTSQVRHLISVVVMMNLTMNMVMHMMINSKLQFCTGRHAG